MNGLGATLVTLHSLSAILWVGGSIFLLVVVVPAGRSTMPLSERALYFRRLDRAFDTIVYIAVAVLFLSGLLQWLGSDLGNQPRNQVLLSVKIVLVLGMLGLRLLRSSGRGPELAQLAAEAIGQGNAATAVERLEVAWKGSVRFLLFEVFLAIPVVFLGVVLGR
jgi:copper resistance protein D